MESFNIFFERRERNPLRKKSLEGGISNLEFVKQESEKLDPKRIAQIEKMKELGVEPERIETFRQAKIKEREKELAKIYFRKKVDKKNLLLEKYGIKVYVDDSVTENFDKRSYNYRILNSVLNRFVTDIKDILPIRKPKIVITDSKINPLSQNIYKTGSTDNPPGFYHDRIIYIDQYSVDEYDVYTHEYAHFIVDRIPKQTEPILKKEYKEMLNSYFMDVHKVKTTRQSLEGSRNEKYRIDMAKRLGLPTDYSTTNFDEWFAELITHWKSLPNNKNTYRFKTILKKILVRI